MKMIDEQLVGRGISDQRVLEAMRRVPRERFVPEDLRARAYEDKALPIAHDQTISQPYIVALMTQLLDLYGNEKVLEIGTGSGYQAAILGELAKDVYTIEIIPELARESSQLLQALAYKNIHVRQGNGYLGWPDHAPFDAIIVTCSPDHVPQPLVDQLKEGGRMVIPVGTWPKNQTLFQYLKVAGKLESRPLIPVSFVPMTGDIK